MGRYICPCCGESLEEDRSFWEELKKGLFDVLDVFYQQLRFYNVSYKGISAIMKFVFPRGKTTVYNAFMESVEKTYIPPVDDKWNRSLRRTTSKNKWNTEISPNIA
uniref:Uncharacterized protein n=1 Tax=Candidatus Methanogaster sp. ANME-2c ERB4 TaxID=2759911 RepID=A0A7G9YFK2_9EURY|nr:hypothetical protein DEIDBPHB_00035 [Methanosarcinales archaeon ANME-2c ERB4]